MGGSVSTDDLTFVSFDPRDRGFVASMPLEGLDSLNGDPEVLLREVGIVYEYYIGVMRSKTANLDSFRKCRIPIPAGQVWDLGDVIFALREDLRRSSFELDGLYRHLARDLGVKQKWLEKVVIFRRYLPSKEYIPDSLNWGRCEKGTRRVAESLRRAE